MENASCGFGHRPMHSQIAFLKDVIILLFMYWYIVYVLVFACMNVCVPYLCLVHAEIRKEHQIS